MFGKRFSDRDSKRKIEMSTTYSATETYTYSDVDVETTFRRFRTDLLMIADSTGAITRAKAEDYAHDAEILAKKGFLKSIDLTLLSAGIEERAVTYQVNRESGGIESSRPGGVLWPRVSDPRFRIILSYTDSYDTTAKTTMENKLRIPWVPSSENTSHASLRKDSGRSFVSNGFGLIRQDFQR